MEDIISQLPDDVLISIITRIPTKEALRTSMVSKRWKNLFNFVSAISFSCHCQCQSTCDSKAIIDGVHGVLQRHSAYIRTFDFRCCLTESYTHIFEQCIYSLGELGIEKLFLRASNKWWPTDVSFSCHLLSHMPSLKYFTLKSCSLQPNLKNPCNSLKTLKLSKVRAPPGSLECILSNCLSLSLLTIKNCEFPSKLCFRGPGLQLKCIAIHDCEGLKEIEFYASNLMTFEFEGREMVNFIFDYVPQLQNIYLSSLSKAMSYVCGRLGKDLPHLKTLLLDNIGDLYEDGSIAMGINMFNNLKRLELTVCYVSSFNLFSLTPLLHSCPLLQEFHLAARALDYDWPDEEKDVVFHSHLKNVEISGFGGTKNEINFALYILKSAVGLQQMYISWHSSMYFGFGEWVEVDHPPIFGKEWSEIYESIEQLKHQAVSMTVQVIFQQFPRIVSKQF